MNWPYVVRCLTFGVLSALWQVGSGIFLMDAMPDSFGWLKLGATAVVAFSGGIFIYARDPQAAWERGGPGK